MNKNIKELRESLLENFEKVKTGDISLKKVSSLNETTREVIKTVALEIRYAQFNGEKKKIEFLEY